MKMNRSTAFMFFFAAVFVSACSDIKLYKPDNPVSVESVGRFCTQLPNSNDRITKFMFVIDKSGSNSGGGFGGGTDPSNKLRADNIEKFFNGADSSGKLRKDNPNIKWGYIAFQGTSATAFINKKGDQDPIYVGLKDNPDSVNSMNKALSRQRGDSDTDSTPYLAALSLTTKAIKNDMKAHPDEQSNYVIFFMSDGMPTDSGNEQPPDQQHFDAVKNLVNLSPGHIYFSAAYYGNEGPDASGGLQKMAEDYGSGKFVDLNKTSDFKIDDLLVAGHSSEVYKVRQLLVYNVNSTVCLDGHIDVDSDGDGLCDRDEVALKSEGFDPQNRFSFGDALGDYIHYRHMHLNEPLPTCVAGDEKDEDHDLLTSCEEKFMSNKNPKILKAAQWPGTSTNPKDPDTDGDRFIDGVEFFMTHDVSSGLDYTNVYNQPYQNRLTIADLIMKHVSPLRDDLGWNPQDVYDGNLIEDGFNDQGQRCYRFTQQHLRTYHTVAVGPGKALSTEYEHGEWENMVLLYFFQSLEKDPSGSGVYMYSLQKITGASQVANTLGTQAGLKVDDSVFKSYEVPTPAN